METAQSKTEVKYKVMTQYCDYLHGNHVGR